jgi:hypothetical protein
VSDNKSEPNCSTGGTSGIARAFKNWFFYFRNTFFRGAKITGEPIFIVGCGHSGTSLLLVILGAHSRIFAVPYESRIAKQCCWRFRAAMRKFNRWAIARGKPRWVEKTPKHILHIDNILKRQPDARVVLIIRDGRDVACSLQKRLGSVEAGIRMWVERNTEGRKYWSHPNVHVLRYEALILDFEKTMREVLAFVGEEYEPGIREYYKSPQKIEKPASESEGNHDQFRNWKVNQPIFDTREKWKKLPEADQAMIHEIGAELLAELGYTEPVVQSGYAPAAESFCATTQSSA